jgi:alpha-tubulin suppressor-like RCC1 family protein
MVRNAGGPVAGIAVWWGVKQGGGTVSGAAASGSDGIASVDWTLGITPGPQVLTASVGSLVGSPAMFSALAAGGAPAALAFDGQPAVGPAGTAITPGFTVSVRDASGYLAPVTTDVSVAITSGTGTAGSVLGGTRTRSTLAGIAIFDDLVVDQIGAGYTLTANALGLASATSDPFSVRGPGIPMQIDLGRGWGYYHALSVHCGLTSGGLSSGGLAYCWGSRDGLLGDGSRDSSYVPRAVVGGLAFTQLAGGGEHRCGLTSGGAAYCWGHNWTGQLGDGSDDDRMVPVPVAGGLVFVQIAAGHNHTCGLTSSGAAYCWGANTYGQLGDGSTETRLLPEPVGGGLLFSGLVTGGEHTCGLTIGGVAYCWGNDPYGQLGTGGTGGGTSVLPAAVSGALVFTDLAAGSSYTCGLLGDGSAYCWGANFSGQLGDGTLVSRSLPTPVAGGLSFSSLAAGVVHTCGLTSGGVAYCWGDNQNGQMGDGVSDYSWRPASVNTGLRFRQLSVTDATSCGIATDGYAYCWGYNSGNFGNGQTASSPTPVRVIGFP